MRKQRPVMVDIDDADPTAAINAFLQNLNKQRELGLCPRTEHVLAEHLFRGDAKIVFYSSARGIISLVESDDMLDDDDAMETLLFIAERRKKRKAKKAAEAASAMSAGTAETAQQAQGDSPPARPEGDAQTPAGEA